MRKPQHIVCLASSCSAENLQFRGHCVSRFFLTFGAFVYTKIVGYVIAYSKLDRKDISGKSLQNVQAVRDEVFVSLLCLFLVLRKLSAPEPYARFPRHSKDHFFFMLLLLFPSFAQLTSNRNLSLYKNSILLIFIITP